MLKLVISLTYIVPCCIAVGCSNDYSKSISDLELSINSCGVSVYRLTSIDEMPVDNNELVGGRSAISNPGTLKLLTDKRYLSFLKKLSQEIEKYPNDVLSKDIR